MGGEAVTFGLEGAAARHQHRLQRVQIGKDAIGHRLIEQRPQPFDRLQLGGIRGQEDQIDPCRDDQGERRRRHRRQQAPPARPRAGAHEAVDGQPRVVALDRGDPPLPLRRPDPAQHRQQAQPVLVLRPEREGCGGMGRPHRGGGSGQAPFLNASWAAGSARRSRGRGRWGVKPRRRSHSQPRLGSTVRPICAPIQAATL